MLQVARTKGEKEEARIGGETAEKRDSSLERGKPRARFVPQLLPEARALRLHSLFIRSTAVTAAILPKGVALMKGVY